MADHVFDRISPVIWLQSKSRVSLGVVEYDINYAYTSPCKVFRRNIMTGLAHNEKLNTDQENSLLSFETNCKALYNLEWLKEVEQLKAVDLPNHPSSLTEGNRRGPYREPRVKRFAESSYIRDRMTIDNVTLITALEIYAVIRSHEILPTSFYTPNSVVSIVTKPTGTFFFETENQVNYRRQITLLRQIMKRLKTLNSIDIYIMQASVRARREAERKIERVTFILDEGLENFPTEYTAWDMTKMVMCPFCIPWITNTAVIRTAEKIKKDLVTEIDSMFRYSPIEHLVINEGRMKRSTDIHKAVSLYREVLAAKITEPMFTPLSATAFAFLGPLGTRLTESPKRIQQRYHITQLRKVLHTLENASNTDLLLYKLNPENVTRVILTKPENEKLDDYHEELTAMEAIGIGLCPLCSPWIKDGAFERKTKQLKWELHQKIDRILEEPETQQWVERIDPKNPKRDKRGVIGDLVGETVKQAVGVITGNIVSNFISYAIEMINPYSNTNRLGRLESTFRDMQENWEISKQIDRGVMDQLDKLSNMAQEITQRMDRHMQYFPQFTWLSSLIANKMTQAALDLQRITDEAKNGYLAIEPFARLTGLSELRKHHIENTQLQSITIINNHTINFKFAALVEAPDTRVYKVHAFDHWDNLDDTPRLMHYTGAEYLIYNETANCIKSLSSSPDEYVGEQCIELDGEDPALNQWEVTKQTENLTEYETRSQVKKTLTANYIYCFPGNITVGKDNYRCPTEAFSLSTSKPFKTAMQRHVPSLVAINSTGVELAVDAVHAGHFRDDSDVIQRMALFDKYREERAKLRNLVDSYKSTVVMKYDSPWFWLAITFYLSTAGGSLTYLLYTFVCKVKQVQPDPVPLNHFSRSMKPTAPPQYEKLMRARMPEPDIDPFNII